MAAETEGIALLSMYGDDEEEEEPAAEATTEASPEVDDGEDGGEIPKYINNKSEPPVEPVHDKTPLPHTSPSPLRFLDGADSKSLRSPFPQRTPTPQPPVSRSQVSSPLSFTSPSPPLPAPVPPSFFQEHLDGQRARRSTLAIVDYAHDETAMSPEAEGMDIASDGYVILGAESHVYDVNIEGTHPVTSQPLAQNSQQETIHLFVEHEQSTSDAGMAQEYSRTEIEVSVVKASSTVSIDIDMQIDEPLQNFLPPHVTTKCPEALQEKINKFLAYKRAGKSFNADLRNRKDYRNPNFLLHAVSYQDIDEIGTCFSKEVFDPHGYDKSEYYDEIEADMKRELEKKDQERKKSQKIDFVSAQSGGVPPTLKMNAHIPAAGVPALLNSALQPNSNLDVMKDSRTNKKSKWDKVDGDAKNSLPSGGHDNLPNASVHAVHLSAANAGTGYSAFAQQKRREAEERRSSERKFDKRS